MNKHNINFTHSLQYYIHSHLPLKIHRLNCIYHYYSFDSGKYHSMNILDSYYNPLISIMIVDNKNLVLPYHCSNCHQDQCQLYHFNTFVAIDCCLYIAIKDCSLNQLFLSMKLYLQFILLHHRLQKVFSSSLSIFIFI